MKPGRFSRRLLVPLILLVGLLGPLIGSSWYTFSLQRETLEEADRFEMEQIVRTLANGMAEPIWNLIPESGRPLLESVMNDPRILGATIDSVAQGHFLSVEKPRPEDADTDVLTHVVVYRGERIGTVAMVVDATSMHTALTTQWRRIIFIGAVQVAFAIAVVSLVMWLTQRLQRASLLRQANIRLENEVVERKHAEAALADSEARYRLLIDQLPEAVFVHVDGRIVYANRAMVAMIGAADAERIVGKGTLDFLSGESRDEILRASREVTRTHARVTLPDLRIHSIDGRTVYAQAVGSLIGWSGRDAIMIVVRDVTEMRRTQEQLLQVQKMQAVGQLTGGLAHDFNNLLAVIRGNAELLQTELGDNSLLAGIDRAATRGAELTQRLLAFSRKQTLQPRAVDLGVLIESLHDLYRRTLGEQVQVVSEVPGGLWPVVADPGQLETALLNLAINARDAMSEGGELRIVCGNIELRKGDPAVDEEVRPGDYVQITVRDTGSGMSKQVVARAFEPFFTTKEVGAGSGLGLSMVYGFARQSGGTAMIESAPGAGTAVTLLLPRASAALVAGEQAERPEVGWRLRRGRNEVVLVLEDEPDVRAFAGAALKALGYRVLEAGDASGARDVMQTADRVDLILSDVVLPGGMSGPAFVAEAKAAYPHVKAVLMTGYAADLPEDAGDFAAGAPVLRKPFRRSALADAVWQALAEYGLDARLRAEDQHDIDDEHR